MKGVSALSKIGLSLLGALALALPSSPLDARVKDCPPGASNCGLWARVHCYCVAWGLDIVIGPDCFCVEGTQNCYPCRELPDCEFLCRDDIYLIRIEPETPPTE